MANANSESQDSKQSSFPSIFNKVCIAPNNLKWPYSVYTCDNSHMSWTFKVITKEKGINNLVAMPTYEEQLAS